MGADGTGLGGFNGQELRGLFAELDRELAVEGLDGRCRIVIVGGAAVALRVPGRVTLDVDVVSEGMPMGLRRAAAKVAARHGLREDWVNDGAKAKRFLCLPTRRSFLRGPVSLWRQQAQSTFWR